LNLLQVLLTLRKYRIVAVMLPPSMALSVFIMASTTLLLGTSLFVLSVDIQLTNKFLIRHASWLGLGKRRHGICIVC